MRTRNQLKATFQTGDKPTQTDYQELIDSLAHKTEDKDKLGGGLKAHLTTRTYDEGEAILRDGKILVSKMNQTGAFNADNWQDFRGDTAGLGINPWDSETEYVYDSEELIQVVHQNAIYEATDTSQGIEPGVDPDWADYWTAIVYTEGGQIPSRPSGGFVRNQTVYEVNGRGLFRANYVQPGFNGGFKSTDFDTEREAGKWVKVASNGIESQTFTGDGSLLQTDSADLPPNVVLWDNGFSLEPGVYLINYTMGLIIDVPAAEGNYPLLVRLVEADSDTQTVNQRYERVVDQFNLPVSGGSMVRSLSLSEILTIEEPGDFYFEVTHGMQGSTNEEMSYRFVLTYLKLG